MNAAARFGARTVGFVFYPRSPRAVTLEQAKTLLSSVPSTLKTVALCVDADDTLIAQLAKLERLDMLQLHGAETPKRVAAIRSIWNRSVMKALPIATADDCTAAALYAPLVDLFLFDAKPPAGGLPGGNALAFDWKLLAGKSFTRPWMLAGGLTPDNVAEAIEISGAQMVDVSSGVESSPGVKSIEKITAFCRAAGVSA
jgi:phosphoribosylanthranilate isomerase